MSIAQAKQEFAIRYYRWSMAGIVEEFAAGFPLARRIKSIGSARLSALLSRLGPEQGLKLLKAKTRRANDIAIRALGEDLTTDELSLIKATCQMLARSISPQEAEYWRMCRAGDPVTRIPRQKLLVLQRYSILRSCRFRDSMAARFRHW